MSFTSSAESDNEKIFALFAAVFFLNVSASDLGGEGGRGMRRGLPGTFTLPLGGRILLTKVPSIGLGFTSGFLVGTGVAWIADISAKIRFMSGAAREACEIKVSLFKGLRDCLVIKKNLFITL